MLHAWLHLSACAGDTVALILLPFLTIVHDAEMLTPDIELMEMHFTVLAVIETVPNKHLLQQRHLL